MAKKKQETAATATATSLNQRRDELKKMAGILNKEYGKPGEPIMMLGDELTAPLRIPTGSISLDWLHGGGHPRRLYSMYWGPENAGKTTTAITEACMAQKADPNCCILFMDGSGRFDGMIQRAKSMGIDLSRFFLVKTDTLEEAVEVYKQVVKRGLIDMAIVDDLAAWSTVKAQYKGNFKEQKERSMTDQTVGAQALANAQFINRTKDATYKKNVALIFTQQARANLDLYGGDFTLPGGHAIKHILVLNTLIERGASGMAPTVDSTMDGDHCGYAMKATITKMQLDGAQFNGTKIVTQFVNGVGIEKGRDAFCFLNERGLIKAAGAKRTLDGKLAELIGLNTGQLDFNGRRAMEVWLQDNYDPIYRHFVPNVDLQIRPEEAEKRVSAEDIKEAQEEALDLINDPNYTPEQGEEE